MLHQHVSCGTEFYCTGGLKLKPQIPAKVNIQDFTENCYLPKYIKKYLFSMANHILKVNMFKNPGQKTRFAIEKNKQKISNK